MYKQFIGDVVCVDYIVSPPDWIRNLIGAYSVPISEVRQTISLFRSNVRIPRSEPDISVVGCIYLELRALETEGGGPKLEFGSWKVSLGFHTK